MISEGQISVAGSVETNSGQQAHHFAGTTTSLPRANSEVALYTPMRRRSLLITPGVATRATTPAASVPPKPRTRHSLPCTPARRGSPEPIDVGPSSLPVLEDPASIPRALTPCDSDYRQTGAFKLGTLRITNASPTRSSVVDSVDEYENPQPTPLSPGSQTDSDYFGSKSMGSGKAQSATLTSAAGYTETRRSSLRSHSAKPPNLGYSLPTIEIHPTNPCMSPQRLPLSGSRSPLSPQSPGLQVTSKNTAMEDELFEDDQREFSPVEVLDVRVDLNAKSLPPRPSFVSEGGSISTELSRADSGIVASPVSEVPQKPLAKADSGYSSNVSLRSFSSRRRVREKDSRSGSELNTPPVCSPKTGEPSSVNLATSEAQGETWPQSVPEKDHRNSLEATNGVSFSRRNLRLLGSFTKKSKASMTEFCTRSEAKAEVQQTTASGTPLSIDITARKQNQIQRFLSVARRKSFSAQTTQTHPSEQTEIPPIPQDIQTNLHRRRGSLPKLMRTDQLKSTRSRDTLGTILSVGSAEASVDTFAPVTPYKSENPEQASSKGAYEQVQEQRPNTTTPLKRAVPLAAHDTNSFANRHSIARKPVPRRTKSGDSGEYAKPSLSQNSSRDSVHNNSENRHIQGRSMSTTTYESRARPNLASGQTTPVVSSSTSNIDSKPAAKNATRAFVNEPPFPTPAELPVTTRSPPPVSMRTRNKGYAPSRPKSTPPGASNVHSGPQPLRKESRDKICGNPSGVSTAHSTSTSTTRNLGHDKLRVRSVKKSQSFVHPDIPNTFSTHSKTSSHQPAVVRRQAGENSTAGWNVPSGHDVSRSRKPSFDRDRTYPISTRSAQGGSDSSRTTSIQGRPEQARPHLVRHSSSYDDRTGSHLQGYSSGNEPSLSSIPQTRGYAYTDGPVMGRSPPQHCNEPPRNIPYVSRSHAHARNRSWGGSCDAYGNPLPFRVLHSYNSPAYRNAPIWG